MLTSAILVAAAIAFANAKGVFYALSANGIDIINPRTLTVEKRLSHDLPIRGTNDVLCTFNPRSRKLCSWGGADVIKGKYLFVANSKGNRVIVIDVLKQVPINSIPTDGFPYQIKYIAALDEVWIFCWKDSHLNVVGNSKNETKIHRIAKASNMMVAYTIKAQIADAYGTAMHGYLQGENCQNVNPNLRYGVVSHFYESGIHKIDLKDKSYKTFINMSSYDCKSTFGLAYSSVKKYAFVQCLGSLRDQNTKKMLIVDVKTEKVVKVNKSITAGATGIPYASPDGKFVVVLNNDKIISYQMRDRQTPIKRLRDIPVKMPSRVAFVAREGGYIAYITLKNSTKIFTIEYSTTGQQTPGSIKNVGRAAAYFSEATMNRYKIRYQRYFRLMLLERNDKFSKAKFNRFLEEMYLAHISRSIATGCHLRDSYVASPAAYEDKVAILDGKTKTLLGLVDNVKKATNVIWVK